MVKVRCFYNEPNGKALKAFYGNDAQVGPKV